jgi:hypothetical protein
MIPGDLASRLRMLTEASFFSGEPTVAPTARVRAVTSILPDFTPGQRITATLQSVAQDNTYHARIDGRDVVLSLPQSVKAGDTLELIVSKVTPQAVMATLAQPSSEAATTSQAALSQTGKLISFLLTGQPTIPSASLNGGQPLLAAAPQTAAATAQLASQLGSAVTESGLFYEAHQARWLSGQLDTAALRREPQGGMPASPQSGSGEPAGTANGLPLEMQTPLATKEAPPGGAAESASSPNNALLSGGKADNAATIAEKLLPIVHQQLDTLATHQAVWQGQIWPGQTMEWEIEDPSTDERNARDGDEEPEAYWNSTLRLTLPSLGGIEARLHLTPTGVAIRLLADDNSTRETLQSGESRLADALAAANVPLTGLVAELRSTP